MSPLVLVVDDEFDIAEVVHLVLEERGFTVLLASDGAEAQAILEKETPALVVTDLMMPRLNGAELIAWLRSQKRLAEVPVISMSAVTPAKNAGWQEFLQKPFTLKRLVAAVTAVLDGAKTETGKPRRR